MIDLIAIDPGISGAWSHFQNGHLTAVEDLPVMGVGARARIDSGAFAAALNCRLVEPRIAVIELVGAMPGQGVSSTFKFGYAAGQIIGVVEALSIPVVWVTPGAWKRSFGLDKDKERARARAIEAFPHLRSSFARKKDHGRAEAALIGLWGVTNTLATAGRGAPSGSVARALPEAQFE